MKMALWSDPGPLRLRIYFPQGGAKGPFINMGPRDFVHKDMIRCIIMLTVKALPAEVQGLSFRLFQLFAAASLFIKTQRIGAASNHPHLQPWRCSQKERREKTLNQYSPRRGGVAWLQIQASKAAVLSAVVRTWSRRRENKINTLSDGVKRYINHELGVTGASDSCCGWQRSTLLVVLVDQPQNQLEHSRVLDSSVVDISQREGLKINTLKLVLDRLQLSHQRTAGTVVQCASELNRNSLSGTKEGNKRERERATETERERKRVKKSGGDTEGAPCDTWIISAVRKRGTSLRLDFNFSWFLSVCGDEEARRSDRGGRQNSGSQLSSWGHCCDAFNDSASAVKRFTWLFSRCCVGASLHFKHIKHGSSQVRLQSQSFKSISESKTKQKQTNNRCMEHIAAAVIASWGMFPSRYRETQLNSRCHSNHSGKRSLAAYFLCSLARVDKLRIQ